MEAGVEPFSPPAGAAPHPHHPPNQISWAHNHGGRRELGDGRLHGFLSPFPLPPHLPTSPDSCGHCASATAAPRDEMANQSLASKERRPAERHSCWYVLLIGAFIALLFAYLAASTPADRGQATAQADVAIAPLGSGAMFDRIAESYDSVNKIISLGSDVAWRKDLVSCVSPQAGDVVLDLATGTADVAIAIAGQNTGVKVVGVDPAHSMLNIGRDKVTAASLDGQVTLSAGDGQALRGHTDGAYDKFSMAFGIRNIPDRLAVLHEVKRVVRPGGRVCILEFSEPRGGVLSPFARLFISYIVPRVGAWISGKHSEYMHLHHSIQAFPQPAGFADEMRSAQLKDVAFEQIHPGGVFLYTARS